MIVAMKKAFVIARQQEKENTLHQLRKLGVLHVSAVPAQVQSAQGWKEKKILLEKALAVLFSTSKNKTSSSPANGASETGSVETVLATARSILDTHEAIRILDEVADNLDQETRRLGEWQGVSVSDMQTIRDQGYEIMFFEVPPKQLDHIPSGLRPFVIKRSRMLLWVALVLKAGTPLNLEFKTLAPPRRGAAELERLRAENKSDRRQFGRELEKLGAEAGILERAVHAVDREIELAEAAAAMGHTEALSFLGGFLPSDQAPVLRKACRDNGWALLLQDPSREDDVPTIVRNQRWIDIIQPVFQLLGTVPGYREFDISFFFLLFFTFFFAAIIGDAGYGLIFFSVSLFFIIRLRRRSKRIPAALSLMMILSSATILWGALTGNWFGSVKLAAWPFLSWMIVPALSSFNPSSGETFKQIFFIVGTVHLSIAHIWNFIRQSKDKPFIRSLAQLGWLTMVLGLYYLVLNMVLSSEKYPMPRHAVWMIGCGLSFIIVFSRQEGRFFHGVAMGIANLLTTFLSSISAFADIISYIRLFAVGLAGIEISKSFNGIAASLGGTIPGIITGGIILLLGHSLNLAMGSLSVVVHGIRLNMLEFSGHLGMEWSGKPYKPFKE
ncbi:MAG: V-type ATP synthase subunit I [Candidatus Aminicenantes bacterium]|nr:V-type ATP synthase subunit I [Candidatus Aminicenantes bacterium]